MTFYEFMLIKVPNLHLEIAEKLQLEECRASFVLWWKVFSLTLLPIDQYPSTIYVRMVLQLWCCKKLFVIGLLIVPSIITFLHFFPLTSCFKIIKNEHLKDLFGSKYVMGSLDEINIMVS